MVTIKISIDGIVKARALKQNPKSLTRSTINTINSNSKKLSKQITDIRPVIGKIKLLFCNRDDEKTDTPEKIIITKNEY